MAYVGLHAILFGDTIITTQPVEDSNYLYKSYACRIEVQESARIAITFPEAEGEAYEYIQAYTALGTRVPIDSLTIVNNTTFEMDLNAGSYKIVLLTKLPFQSKVLSEPEHQMLPPSDIYAGHPTLASMVSTHIHVWKSLLDEAELQVGGQNPGYFNHELSALEAIENAVQFEIEAQQTMQERRAEILSYMGSILQQLKEPNADMRDIVTLQAEKLEYFLTDEFLPTAAKYKAPTEFDLPALHIDDVDGSAIANSSEAMRTPVGGSFTKDASKCECEEGSQGGCGCALGQCLNGHIV